MRNNDVYITLTYVSDVIIMFLLSYKMENSTPIKNWLIKLINLINKNVEVLTTI